MKQIKTVICRMSQTAEFDAEVNAAIKNGWELTRRGPVPMGQTIDGVHYSSSVLLAELEIEMDCCVCKHANKDAKDEPCVGCSYCTNDDADTLKWEPQE